MSNITDALPISKKDLMSILNAIIPSGAIMWFDLEEPPEGWEVYTPLLGKYPLGANTEIGSPIEAGLPEVCGLFAGVGQASSSTSAVQSYATGAIRYAFDGNDETITENKLGVKVSNDSAADYDDVFSFRASAGELKPEFYNATNKTLALNPNDAYVGSENSVFGKSNTVTPPSVKLLPCRKK